MRACWIVLFYVCVGCRALPPPPVLAPHAPTEPDRIGDTTAMVVVGVVDQFWGGDGWGVALRVEHQRTDRTTAGLELTGGRGSQGRYESGEIFRQSLVGLRAYGRYSPPGNDELAIGAGAGISWMRTGLVTGTLHTSFTASYPNGSFVPLGSIGVALAIPLRHGRAYGDVPFTLGPPDPGTPEYQQRPVFRTPAVDAFLTFDAGALVPIGDTGNRLSLDLGAAIALRAGQLLVSANTADAQRVR